MKKIVIVSGIQIIDNPRVVKEATALANAGFDVEVIGAIYDAASAKRINRMLSQTKWRHVPIIDRGLEVRLYYLYARIRRKIALLQKKWLNWENPYQLGYFVKRLYRIAKQRNADLYIVHLEQALWVGKRLLETGHEVAIDVEDWYSEDCLPADRVLRPIRLLKDCEQYLLQNAVYSTTTSMALSNALAEAYHCPPATVIYNSFPAEGRQYIDGEILDRRNSEIPSITWFSQTIGPGRGLEQLIVALKGIDSPFELHIRGASRPGFKEVLVDGLPVSMAGNIFFHSQVPQDELLSRLSEHDIGFCGELSDCRSRDLTITNKALEYLRAGLAVIASDTAGHQEVATLVASGVFIYQQDSVSSLKRAMQTLLGDEVKLVAAKQASLEGIESVLAWNKSEARLISLCQQACNA